MSKKIVKTFPLTKDESGWITVNTSAVDRDKDRVLPSGVVLDNYLEHPILLFGHNYSEPWAVVGRAEDIQVDDEAVKILPDLRAPANESDPMHIIQVLWDARLLASSIGFNPEEWTENEFGGLDYTRWELLEISLVPVPANQEALRLTVKALGDKSEGALSSTTTDTALLTPEKLTELLDTPVATPPDTADASTPMLDVAALRTLLREALAAKDPQSSGSNDLAWVRRLTVMSNKGEQTLFAIFRSFSIDIPKDAEKLDFDEDDELVTIPHPDAGENIAKKEVTFVPPIAFICEKWGDDAIYSVSAPEQSDSEIVGPWEDEYEVLELSEILLSLPSPTKGWKSFTATTLGLCRLTQRGAERVKKMVRKMQKTVIPYSAHGDVPAAPEDQEWSGADARKRLREWAGGDEWDATKYRQGFAFADGDPLLLGSYKGPHHDIVDGAFSTVWAGVHSAMAALVYDARGGMIADEDDRRSVFLHLEKHYAQWDKEPPEFRDYELDELRILFPDEFKEPEPILTDDIQGDQEADVSDADVIEPGPGADEGDDVELPPEAMDALYAAMLEMLSMLGELLATSEDEDEQMTDENEEG